MEYENSEAYPYPPALPFKTVFGINPQPPIPPNMAEMAFPTPNPVISISCISILKQEQQEIRSRKYGCIMNF